MTLGQNYYIRYMKRAASAILLSIFLFSNIGYYVVFFVLNGQHKSEMQRFVLNEKNLETIRIHKSEIKKNIIIKNDGKEIAYMGEMYDVKNKFFDGDYIVFHCKHDRKETKFLAGLEKYVKYNSDSKSSSEKKQNNKNSIKDLFFNSSNLPFSTSTPFEFKSYSLHLTSYIFPTLPFPPPENIS